MTHSDWIAEQLLDLKARQQAGEHMPCPRCGKDTMLCRRRYAGARRCLNLR